MTSADLPRSKGHPFYEKLNELLEGAKFDDFVEELVRPSYAEFVGRPGVVPGVYFRMLLVGYFEDIGSQGRSARSARTACRCGNSWACGWTRECQTTRR